MQLGHKKVRVRFHLLFRWLIQRTAILGSGASPTLATVHSNG